MPKENPMTLTTARSRNRSASVVTVVALLAAFRIFAATPARAADPPAHAIDVWETALELPIADEGNMRFGPATVDLQDGNRVKIAADVTVTGSDGRQTTSGIIAILIGLVASPSTGFMDYTDDACLADGVAASERGISDGSSNTIMFGARACAAIARAWNAYLDGRRGPSSFSGDAYDNEMGVRR
jgi:hypothetical protein